MEDGRAVCEQQHIRSELSINYSLVSPVGFTISLKTLNPNEHVLAVFAELERLERELPKVPRQYPNRPVGVSSPTLNVSPKRARSQASSPVSGAQRCQPCS